MVPTAGEHVLLSPPPSVSTSPMASSPSVGATRSQAGLAACQRQPGAVVVRRLVCSLPRGSGPPVTPFPGEVTDLDVHQAQLWTSRSDPAEPGRLCLCSNTRRCARHSARYSESGTPRVALLSVRTVLSSRTSRSSLRCGLPHDVAVLTSGNPVRPRRRREVFTTRHPAGGFAQWKHCAPFMLQYLLAATL